MSWGALGLAPADAKEGAPLRIARTSGDGYEPIGTGVAAITRSGTDRIVRVLLEDGSTLIITIY